MEWFDAGVNCFDPRLPLDETIQSAKDANVNRMCVIATSPEEWQPSLDSVKRYSEQLCCTIGIHPHYADKAPSDFATQISNLAKSERIAAIGECGLDYNRMFSSRENQLSVFEQQLELARDLGLPVYLHERDAFDDQISLLTRYISQLRGGLAHCFTSHKAHLKAYLDLGLFIGITGWVCDPKRGEDLREALQYLPLDRIVLETDSPYLFPKGLKPRQRNNQPAFLPFIAERVAALKGVSVEQLNQASIINTNMLLWRDYEY